MCSVFKKLIRDILRWPFLVILAMSVLLALVIPPEWVQSIPGVTPLLQAVINAVPAVRDYIHVSRFPSIAEVYFPLMLLISPLHFVWTWKSMEHERWRVKFKTKPAKAFFSLVVAAGLTALVGWASFLVGGGQLNVIPWNESRAALAAGGYLASGGGFFIALAALVAGFKALLERIGERNG